MKTAAGRHPAFRPESDLVVLARDHLDALVRVLADGDETASEDLHALGLSGDPTTIGPARSLAAAWARSSATVVVTRAGGGVRRAVEVRWGPAGVVALPVAPAHEPVAVAVAPPTALVACLWRLLRLGPRRRHDRTSPALDATDLTAPFDDGIDGGWTRALGVEGEAAVLSRLELREHHAAEPLVLGLVDDGTALWDVASDDGRVFVARPTDPTTLVRTLSGWQERLLLRRGASVARPAPLGQMGPPDLDADLDVEDEFRGVGSEVLDLGGVSVRLTVPGSWQRLAPPQGVLAAWRDDPGEDFAVNVTVTSHNGAPQSPAEVADRLPHGRWLDEPEPAVAVLLHRGPTTDVVTTQRQLPLASGCVTVSYTCAVHQARTWLPRHIRWATRVQADRGES